MMDFSKWAKEQRVRAEEKLKKLEEEWMVNSYLPLDREELEACKASTEEIKLARHTLRQYVTLVIRCTEKITCIRAISTEMLRSPLQFSRFPPEIRKMILEYILVQPYPFQPFLQRPHLDLNLFYTSKQMKEEASRLFYGHNKFEFHGSSIQKFPISALKRIRDITLYLNKPSPKCFEILMRSEELQSLKIVISCVFRSDRLFFIRRIYRGFM
ncbi:hypothetical protein F5884DRAFT_149620 [Xylogone sp. PMI_703]|nr:hypothetical protein F5884DRAFT_149620 [Xylogone sp. PMI_703]